MPKIHLYAHIYKYNTLVYIDHKYINSAESEKTTKQIIFKLFLVHYAYMNKQTALKSVKNASEENEMIQVYTVTCLQK